MASDEIFWSWKDFCATGLNISTNSSSINPCAQQIYLHLPTFSLLAVLSSYHYGKLIDPVLRNKKQLWNLTIRALVSLTLAILPVAKLIYEMKNQVKIWPIDVLLACTEALCWTIHFG